MKELLSFFILSFSSPSFLSFKMSSPNYGIYVANLSFFTTEETLGNFLSECGTITRVFLPRDSDRKNRGCANVLFFSAMTGLTTDR